jgi:2-dehydropantoate 2-reductase
VTRIAVFGAGAIGCWVGGWLSAGGNDVTLIGRPRLMAELASGLEVNDLAQPTRHATPTLATDAAAARSADVVLVTVKSAATAEAGAELARVIGERVVVVSLQNGVRNAPTLRTALPKHTVLAGMVGFNTARVGPGHYHRGTTGEIFVEAHPDVERLVVACRDAKLALAARSDILAVQWAKLVMNLNNAINALSGQPLAAELADRDFRRCLSAAMAEALDVLAAAKLPVATLLRLPPRWVARLLPMPDWIFSAVARRLVSTDPEVRSSMADDFAAGRTTEVDYLQGEVVALAARVGRQAPVNRSLVELVHAAEAGGKRDFSGAALLAAVTNLRPPTT